MISVIIPTYNSEKFIIKTLHSVKDQSFKEFEIIISDDGSTDNTISVLEKFKMENPSIRTTIIANSHQGPGATRNIGVSRAQYEWISFLDSDDYWEKEKLERVAIKISDECLDLVFHDEMTDYPDRQEPLLHSQKYDPSVPLFIAILRRNFLSPSAVTMRKKIFLEVGGFDVSLPSAQDFDLWLNLASSFELKLGFIAEILGHYVIRKGSISFNPIKRKDCMIRISRKHYESIRKFSPSPFIEKYQFLGMSLQVVGRQAIAQKKWLLGLSWLILGLIYNPRIDLMKRFLNKFTK
jgi:glycosyltransferase involved in cell wall biosynthesis